MPPEDHDPTTPEEREHMRKQLQRLRESAERGEAQAQRDLGCAYIWGEDSWEDLLAKDETQARHWYSLAAEQGHAEAMWDVCRMLLDGEGGPPDIERGLRYMRTLARHRRWSNESEASAELLIYFHQNGQYGLPSKPAAIAEWEQRLRDQKRKARGYNRRHMSRRKQRNFERKLKELRDEPPDNETD